MRLSARVRARPGFSLRGTTPRKARGLESKTTTDAGVERRAGVKVAAVVLMVMVLTLRLQVMGERVDARAHLAQQRLKRGE